MTTSASMFRSMARKTDPIPPSPSLAVIRYRPLARANPSHSVDVAMRAYPIHRGPRQVSMLTSISRRERSSGVQPVGPLSPNIKPRLIDPPSIAHDHTRKPRGAKVPEQAEAASRALTGQKRICTLSQRRIGS